MMSNALTRAATAVTARAATMVTGTALAASEVTPRLASYSPALTFITKLIKTNEVLDRSMGRKKTEALTDCSQAVAVTIKAALSRVHLLLL